VVAPPQPAAPQKGAWMFDDDDPTVMKSPGVPTPIPSSTAGSSGVPQVDDKPSERPLEPLVRKRADDAALSRAIDAALDTDEETPPAK
jgi:hypothetical protein